MQTVPSDNSTHPRMRRVVLAGLLAFTVWLAMASPAIAGTIKKSIWGPATPEAFSEHYCPLGVGLYQYPLFWHLAAPSQPANPQDPNDPAYDWPEELDTAIAEGSKCGIRVAIMLIGAPQWANGGGPFNDPPLDDASYATFAAAASRRYTSVHHWMVWGEPNRPANWSLTVPTSGLRVKKNLRSAPRRYATLLDAAYGSLKAVNPANLVIGGMTYTAGSFAFPPLAWLRYMKLPSGKPPRFDMYGHNPFTTRKPNLKRGQIKKAYADFSDLDTLFDELDRHQRQGKRRPKVFISEFSIPTDFSTVFLRFHVSKKTQARWLRAALKITRKTKRIYTLGWYTLYDLAAGLPGGPINWGLLTADGIRKPAWYTFQKG
jgi:hypothetical protein